jgi:hypothetical protein
VPPSWVVEVGQLWLGAAERSLLWLERKWEQERQSLQWLRG